MVILIWIVMLKGNAAFTLMGPHFRSINLIPFYYMHDLGFTVMEVSANFAIFIPFGIYMNIFRAERKLRSKIFSCFLLSLIFEVLQFITGFGMSDITDIIANTAGGAAGIFICFLFKRLFGEKYLAVINGCGIAAGLLFVVFLLVC